MRKHLNTRLKLVNTLLFTVLSALAQQAGADAPQLPETPPGIQGVTLGHGWTFADSHGMTLYVYGNDQKKPNGSLCVEGCVRQWPPLLADDDAQPVGHWGFATRDEGTRQWALQGQPVYRYADDPEPGARFGDGYDRLWSVAELLISTPPQMSITRTILGRTLATKQGKTLYSPVAPCDGVCLDQWAPLTAPAVALNPWDDWAVVERADGVYQWTYQSRPLFTFAGDVNAREVFGSEYDPDVWQAVVLESNPPMPEWVKPVGTDAGQMLGNADGKVIYYYVKRPWDEECYGYKRPCIFPEWQPILADEDAKPIGDWTILLQPDGTRQWGYKGHRMYTSTLDKYPGEFRGIIFGGSRGLKVIMRNGDRLQGLGNAGS